MTTVGARFVRYATAAALLLAAGCHRTDDAVSDEAAVAGLDESHFRHADENYFKDMDGAVPLDAKEAAGRNMWLVWSGGNDRFWNGMARPTFGGFDLLKIVAPDPRGPNRRAMRWETLGLVNEPCFAAPTAPDARFGLWLDTRSAACPPDPFADEVKYPGVKIGARGTELQLGPSWIAGLARGKIGPQGRQMVLPVGSYYGYPSGIVGLRLFPNPDFDAVAAERWDPKRYYSDPRYYTDPNLVRPYRVGMSCGFCHVGPSPSHPPKDPANPQYSELSSTVGAQYMWVDRLFFWNPDPKSFMYQWVKTFRPGAMDTSLVSTDNINNPRTMNAIYSLEDRLEVGKRLGHETLAGGGLDNKQFNDYVDKGPLTEFFTKPDKVGTPHVLKDGSDSVGALGALNRVYLNIGLFSEEWLRHFNPVAGGKPISPMKISVAEKNSPYWRATEAGTPATALFFLKAGRPDRLAAIPGGAAFTAAPPATLALGRQVFADTCARCHSSKAPEPPADARIADAIGPGYLARFANWWRWTTTPEFKQAMRAIVDRPDFLDHNYLSSEVRVPVTLLRTNICSPLASNALRGNIWDNFSSESYKTLPSVGTVSFQDPFTGGWLRYNMPGGGRGYTRPPSLTSLWSTAPFLLNNSVGPFVSDPSVAGRMRSFDASIRQMLWPETRLRDPELGNKVEGVIDRTTARSYIFVPKSFVPALPGAAGAEEQRLLEKLVDAQGNIVIGPIPQGMPVNLLASLQPLAESKDPRVVAQHYGRILKLLVDLKLALATAPKGATDVELRQHFAGLRGPLMALSKCPDYVVNRGHYFGTAKFNDTTGLTDQEKAWGTQPVLADAEKRALVEYLKTL